MKNFLPISLILLCIAAPTIAQKSALDFLRISSDTPAEEFKTLGTEQDTIQKKTNSTPLNLVSRPSFKRIFQRDFSSLSGNNNLPTNQLIVSLNQPEIQVGQLFNLYTNSYKSIPLIGLYPFVKGKLNKNDEFGLVKNRKIDPGIDFGGRIVLNLIGLRNGTGYFYNSIDSSTIMFNIKNNILKQRLRIEYSLSEIVNTINTLENENKSTLNDIDSLRNASPTNNIKIIKMQQAIAENSTRILELKELSKNPAKLKKFIEDMVFEAEKDAPWTTRRFLWVTAEGKSGKQSANIFRNNEIEENHSFNRNTFGFSANFSSFRGNRVFNAFIKYERTIINKFLSTDPITLYKDSLLSNSGYKVMSSTDVYDVSKLTSSEFSKKGGDNLLTIGSTFVFGDIKKWGFTGSYRSNLDSKITNLNLGLIIPVIMDNSKAEQSNIILEWVMPDINTKSIVNIENKRSGQTLMNRSYLNLKVGIPINVL